MIARFGDLLANVAHRYPEAPAVTFLGHTRNWADVYARCRNIAAAFEDMGLEPSDRVAYLGFNSDTLFELFFAPAMARLETVVMNFRWSLPECIAALEDTASRVLVFDAAHADMAMAAAAACPSVTHLFQTGDAAPAGATSIDDLTRRDGHPSTEGSGGDDTLIIFFTGGTTGRSKGVMISHHNLLTNALGAPPIMRNQIGRAQIIIGPMFHMAPGSRVFSAVLLNAHSVIMPRFDMVEMMELVARHRVHAVTMVPTMMHMLLEHPEFKRHDLSSLGPIMLGGSPTPP